MTPETGAMWTSTPLERQQAARIAELEAWYTEAKRRLEGHAESALSKNEQCQRMREEIDALEAQAAKDRALREACYPAEGFSPLMSAIHSADYQRLCGVGNGLREIARLAREAREAAK